MPYLWAPGHDVPLEDLLVVIGQCSSEGMQYTRRQYGASGKVIDEGAFIELFFSTINIARYQALLAQIALLTTDEVTTAPVSVYVPDRKFNWVLRNGIVVAPEPGSDGKRTNYLLHDYVFLIKSLQAQA